MAELKVTISLISTTLKPVFWIFKNFNNYKYDWVNFSYDQMVANKKPSVDVVVNYWDKRFVTLMSLGSAPRT